MALKRKIDKAAWEALSEDLKKEYKEVSGSYVLDVDADEDTSALKRAKDREKQRADEAEKERDELKAKLEEDADIGARKKGDIETLEKSWQAKLDKQTKEAADKLANKDAFIKDTLVDSVAKGLATKLSSSPALLIPHIKARLMADVDGDTPATKVLDAEGKPSALSIDDLEKEIVANKDYAAIIVGSRATGSGAANPPNKPSGAALKKSTSDEPVDLAKTKPSSLVDLIRSKAEATE